MNLHQRLGIVDNSLDHFAEVFERGSLSTDFRHLFEAFGMEDLFEQSFNRETYTAVAPEEGVLDVSHFTEHGGIPVVALIPGEIITVIGDVSERHQDTTTEMSVWEGATAEHIEDPDHETAAAIYRPVGIEDDKGTPIMHLGTPLFAINCVAGVMKLGRTCPSVVGHEMVHVGQALQYRPRQIGTKDTFKVQLGEIKLTHELQAYALQAAMDDEVFFADEPVRSLDFALIVDGIRRKVQQDSLELTPALVRALRSHSVARRILPSSLA